MNDATITIQELKDAATAFVNERDWQQFHGPKNLSTGIAIEAAELMDLFAWVKDKQEAAAIVEAKRKHVEQELADIIITTLLFAQDSNIDVSQAVKEKLALNRAKYPIEKAKGNNLKYTDL